MNILKEIEKDLKISLLKKKKTKVSTLRLLLSALKNKEIELRPQKKELDEEEIIKVIKNEVKKRKEAIEFYKEGRRKDLADQEKEELEILKKYLPKELSDKEIIKTIQQKIKELPGETNFGKIMGIVMKEIVNRADGKRVAELVKKELNKIKN